MRLLSSEILRVALYTSLRKSSASAGEKAYIASLISSWIVTCALCRTRQISGGPGLAFVYVMISAMPLKYVIDDSYHGMASEDGKPRKNPAFRRRGRVLIFACEALNKQKKMSGFHHMAPASAWCWLNLPSLVFVLISESNSEGRCVLIRRLKTRDWKTWDHHTVGMVENARPVAH